MLLASPNVTSIVDNWHVQKQRTFIDPVCHDITQLQTILERVKSNLNPSITLNYKELSALIK